jgi:LuxR family maltose regulon positive regulatory protein
VDATTAVSRRSARRGASAFLAPQLPTSLVERPRLEGLLGVDRGAAWTLVVGPAGSGKTTLVRSWMHARVEPWAWITLTSARYRQFGLAEKIVRSVQAVHPDPLDTVDDIGDSGIGDLGMLHHLLDELSMNGRSPTVVVIDDAHLLRADEWGLLRPVIAQLPPSLHLVVVSRSEPPIPLGRERATERLAMVRSPELAFDLAETSGLLELVAGSSSDEAARTLLDTTEGWATGIRLAALAIRDGVDAENLLDRLGHRSSSVAEFLVEEVLDHLSVEERRDLGRMSLLRLLEPDLCDAVTGDSMSTQLLRSLARDGSFVVSIDDAADRFRFHPLLATLLRSELEHSDPGAARAAHLAAADWLLEHDRPIESIEHLLVADEHQRAHDLVMDFFRPLYIGTHRHDIDRWLTAIPDEVISEDPERALEHCVALALIAHDQAAPWLRYCLEHVPTEDDWLMSRMDAILALEHIVNGRLEEARASWRRSMHRRPEHRTEPMDEVLLSWDIRLGAMLEDATRAVVSARRLQEMDRVLVTDAPAMSVLAGALAASGDRASARVVADRAIAMWRDLGEPGLPGMVDALVVAAGDARRTGDFVSAVEHLDAALALVPEWAPGPNALTMIPLVERARVAHDCGDPSWREQLLGLAEVLRTGGRPSDVVDWVERARLELECAAQPSRPVSPDVAMTDVLTDRELTILGLLSGHLSLPEIAIELFISPHTVRTHVKNVYRKLGVSSRSQAVRTARDLGLLA